MHEGMQSQIYEQIEVANRNRTRLMLQNKKLLSEINKLQKIIALILQKNETNHLDLHQSTQELKAKFNIETEQQAKLILRLKKQIKQLKSSLADGQIQEVKKQENQIVFLKRELDKLFEERRIMILKKNQKNEALEFYKPINTQTADTLNKYKKIKSGNSDLKNKIHELEREVAKYHKYKELGKGFVPKEYENPDYHFMKIDNEIKNMRKEMKRIEEKWRSKVQSLDRQFFSFKTILIDKDITLDNLQKQAKNLENRITGMRDLVQASLDRERINGVIISPQKKKEMQEMLQEEKKKYKRLQTKKIQKKQYSPEKIKIMTKQPFIKPIPQKPEQNKSQKPQQNTKQAHTHYSQKKKKQETEQLIPPVEPVIVLKKMVESIGVGTTFYYQD